MGTPPTPAPPFTNSDMLQIYDAIYENGGAPITGFALETTLADFKAENNANLNLFLKDGNGVPIADIVSLLNIQIQIITGQGGTPEYYGGNSPDVATAGAAMASQIAALKGNYATCFVSSSGIIPKSDLTYDWYIVALI